MRLVGLMAAIMMPAASPAAAVPNRATVARLAGEAMASSGAKGLAIALVDRGKVVSVQAFGERNAKRDPLTVDTIMYGASLTKAVFGYYAMMLVDDRKLDLDRPIAAMLPKPLPDYGNLDAYGNWGDLAGDARWRKITPRHLLTHSSGFANFSFLEPDGKLKFHFDPGTRYAYSGEGIILLQFAIEQGLRVDVGAEVSRRIFAPLKMNRTSLKWRPDFAANLADGWMRTASRNRMTSAAGCGRRDRWIPISPTWRSSRRRWCAAGTSSPRHARPMERRNWRSPRASNSRP